MIDKALLKRVRVAPGTKVHLGEYETGWALTDELRQLGKDKIKERSSQILRSSREKLAKAQDLLYSSSACSVLVILQAMDAAGKDGTIKHVMSGVNPQGCQVHSFKKPTQEELSHDFLWRYNRALPERGRIGIFNRSYYEEVLVVRVHPEWLGPGVAGTTDVGPKFWKRRFNDINAFERHLTRNGTILLKFFLHISKDEQKRRFLERLNRPEKHWKYSPDDLAERKHWDEYMAAYEAAISATSTRWAPWYIVPADKKWVARSVVADLLTTTIRKLDLKYPTLTPEQIEGLASARRALEQE